MPAVDLRELVGKPVELTGVLRAHRQPHKLHEAIPAEKKYVSNAGPPILLPPSGRGLTRLTEFLAQSSPGMARELEQEAKVRLLVSGVSAHCLGPATSFGPDREPLSPEDSAQVSSVALTAVFRADSETLNHGALSAQRFGAVATLHVLRSAGDRRMIVDAWADVTWVYSASELLEALAGVTALVPDAPKLSRQMAILVSPSFGQLSSEFDTELQKLARFCGAAPTVHHLVPKHIGAIQALLKRSLPNEVIMLGGELDNPVAAEFIRRRGLNNLHTPHSVNDEGTMLQWARQNFPRLMGVSAGLFPTADAPTQSDRPPLPVNRATECRHVGEVPYVHDAEQGLWWTRDNAKHGGVEFKSYRKTGDELRWVGDHDGEGRRIEGKHKGKYGKTVPLKGSIGCPYPHSHLE